MYIYTDIYRITDQSYTGIATTLHLGMGNVSNSVLVEDFDLHVPFKSILYKYTCGFVRSGNWHPQMCGCVASDTQTRTHGHTDTQTHRHTDTHTHTHTHAHAHTRTHTHTHVYTHIKLQ